MCECIPKALQLNGEATASSIDASDLSDSGTSELIKRSAELLQVQFSHSPKFLYAYTTAVFRE